MTLTLGYLFIVVVVKGEQVLVLLLVLLLLLLLVDLGGVVGRIPLLSGRPFEQDASVTWGLVFLV
jgi:hypothetical protein